MYGKERKGMGDVAHEAGNTAEQERDAFSERLLRDVAGTFSIFSIYVGDRLGLYRGLVEGGPASAAELAARTGTQERYVREWLEQQCTANIVEVQDESLEAAQRRYSLPTGRAEALTDCESLNYLAPMAQLMAGVVKPLEALLEAYRHGGGVPFSAYGVDLREGQGALNYPAFMYELSQVWLPSMADVHKRLQGDPPARAADIGCGYGWSSIGMARGYPKIHVDGFDLDGPSIERARENAIQSQVAERVNFRVRDAGDPSLAGQYDLVTAFECIHDLADPVGVLRKMRQLTTEGGTVLVADERVGDQFRAHGNEGDWMAYGFSVLHCLPVGMADRPSAGTGAVMRPDTLRAYALEAGFSEVEILPIESSFFRFYRLK
jgi:2-polyprenyl-3-methyl-5-hydroxy-6-metoxy-1,4-benzoquinol methylase